jgi:hypothetical protein
MGGSCPLISGLSEVSESEGPSPRPMASQARHEMGAPGCETASRNVVPIGWGEGADFLRAFTQGAPASRDCPGLI